MKYTVSWWDNKLQKTDDCTYSSFDCLAIPIGYIIRYALSLIFKNRHSHWMLEKRHYRTSYMPPRETRACEYFNYQGNCRFIRDSVAYAWIVEKDGALKLKKYEKNEPRYDKFPEINDYGTYIETETTNLFYN